MCKFKFHQKLSEEEEQERTRTRTGTGASFELIDRDAPSKIHLLRNYYDMFSCLPLPNVPRNAQVINPRYVEVLGRCLSMKS